MKRPKKRLKILITAGPTREPIDPVRFISNYSTGFLGYEIARNAKKRGHQVILISGPALFAKPKSVRSIDVVTAQQMQEKVQNRFSWCDCLIMTAAVGDFRARRKAKAKIKRDKSRQFSLELQENPDILAGLGRKKGKRALVGFALETEGLRKNALSKLRRKNLDLIVATPMKRGGCPFGQTAIDSLIIDKSGRINRIKQATKPRLSRILLDSIEKIVLS